MADIKTLTVLARLRNDKDFTVVLDFVRGIAARNAHTSVQERDDITLRRAQGAAIEFGEFIQLCEQAPVILEQRRQGERQNAQTESRI